MPRLSVLLPCRDAAAHLHECIASLDAQSFMDYEVIAVDDGSSDRTGALLDAWASSDSRVCVLHTAGRGVVSALQSATGRASGELIARMDADDIAHPQRFARQIELLDTARIAACGTRVRYFPREALKDGAVRYERWVNSVITSAEIARDIFVECPLPHPTLMLRRDVLERAGGYRDAGWAEDYDLVLRLWAEGEALGKVPEVLLSWREGAGRLSRTDPLYAEASFRACKVHYLEQTFLLARRDIFVCGAGPVGKAFARDLAARGHRIRAFVELNPRKIGQTIHGARVIGYGSLGAPDGAFALAAVAGDDGRSQIRDTLAAAGWEEMRDFCTVA